MSPTPPEQTEEQKLEALLAARRALRAQAALAASRERDRQEALRVAAEKKRLDDEAERKRIADEDAQREQERQDDEADRAQIKAALEKAKKEAEEKAKTASPSRSVRDVVFLSTTLLIIGTVCQRRGWSFEARETSADHPARY